jgi:hypothetical protein
MGIMECVCVQALVNTMEEKKLNLKLALPELEVIQDGGILDKAV